MTDQDMIKFQFNESKIELPKITAHAEWEKIKRAMEIWFEDEVEVSS